MQDKWKMSSDCPKFFGNSKFSRYIKIEGFSRVIIEDQETKFLSSTQTELKLLKGKMVR